MSENPDGLEQWRRMLESMLGEEGAREALEALSASGMDLSQLASTGALANPEQIQAAMSQMQQLLGADDDGTSQWQFARDVARQSAHSGGDPVVTAAVAEKTRSVLSVADLWVDAATDLPPTSGENTAAARVEWVDEALPTLRMVADPIGESVSHALVKTLQEQMGDATPFGPMDISSMMTKLGKLGFAMQVGQAAGTLAREVFGSTDTGLPLLATGRMLVPANIAAFAEELDTPEDEVWHFIAVRETAHARLYQHVPWLRSHLTGAVEQYARGIEIDIDQLEQSVRDIDPTNMDQLRDALSGDIFLGEPTESQQQALNRLETTLALVEGWVEEVTATAVAAHLPHAVPLREMFRRRRAAGGPAEDTFHTLVGLELRPRRAREAAGLWAELSRSRGIDGRDGLWNQLDLMPTSDDLDDPTEFIDGLTGDFADLDAELAKIFESADREASDEESSAPEDDPTSDDED